MSDSPLNPRMNRADVLFLAAVELGCEPTMARYPGIDVDVWHCTCTRAQHASFSTVISQSALDVIRGLA